MKLRLLVSRTVSAEAGFNENICFLASQSVFVLSRVYSPDMLEKHAKEAGANYCSKLENQTSE